MPRFSEICAAIHQRAPWRSILGDRETAKRRVLGRRSRIEHWRVRCDVTVRRNFLAILETDQLRMLQLAPGASLADPVLQRDAARGIHAHAAQGKPGGCDAPGTVIDTAVSRMPERPGRP
ncbi:MAG: hypothetical protein ACK51F_10180, partial [Rhodospirillales bacterium]